MILNENIDLIFFRCMLCGAPNETVTLKNLDTNQEQTYKLNSEGIILLDSFLYGMYFITGSISKQAIPNGRLAFFDEKSEEITYNGIKYKMLTVYPEKTWFWFGKQFGEWKGSQYVPDSKPFSDNTYYQDEKIKDTTSFDKNKRCLKIYSQSSKKDKPYAWSGNVQKILTPGNSKRVCFLAKANLSGGKEKTATVGLGHNSNDASNVNIGNQYRFLLQANVGTEKDIYMADVTRYSDQDCMPVAFVANDSTSNGTIKSTSLEIYAIWMDEIPAQGTGKTKIIEEKASNTLRSEICATAGTRWQKAFAISSSGENFVGRSTDYGASGLDTNSSMAVELSFNFPGQSQRLRMEGSFYLPYAPWVGYWAITTNLEPYRAKSISQAKNGIFPQVTNDKKQLAKGEFTFKEGKVSMEFPCLNIPKNEKFYLILYTKVANKYGAIHARGTVKVWVEYGVDR